MLLTFPTLAQEREKILEVMSRQEKYWNEGNIPAFMQDYWKSDSLKFIGKNGVTKGWQATMDRYLKTYPDKASMGTLKFDIKEVEFLSDKAAWVLGQFYLTRPEKGDLTGFFTLIFKKINQRWVIVSDHSS
ncbi:YybH family protein [Leadbetterella byssophila]|nr:nuclear transport factor 2 family protein [Leadbetterella byssophila]